MRKQLIALLLTPILAVSSLQAADAVRWEDLPKKIGKGSGREYTVLTKDGNAKRGVALAVTVKGIRFSDTGPVIPLEDVAEIRIHHHLEMGKASGLPTGAVFSGVNEGWILFFPILLPAALAVYAVTAPPAIAVEGVRRALPDKVIKVAP